MSKKSNQTPRRKRMKRQDRLQSAKYWIGTYSGKHIVRVYRNWFGVDLLCAITELQMLGVILDKDYIAQAIKSSEQLIASRKKKKQELNETSEYAEDEYYFIAGYTSGGFPYGITWEEANEGSQTQHQGYQEN